LFNRRGVVLEHRLAGISKLLARMELLCSLLKATASGSYRAVAQIEMPITLLLLVANLLSCAGRMCPAMVPLGDNLSHV
jgi:hypothetical protein